jgi:hypothetical protein
LDVSAVGAGGNLDDALAGSVLGVGACGNLTGSRAGSNLAGFLDLDLLLYLDGSDAAVSLALAPADATIPLSENEFNAPVASESNRDSCVSNPAFHPAFHPCAC